MSAGISKLVAMSLAVFVVLAGASRTARSQPAPVEAKPPEFQRRIPPPPAKQQERKPRAEQDRWAVNYQDIPPKTRLASFESDLIKSFVNYVVYTPPDYERNQRARYPTIYLLPSLSGDCREVGPMVEKFHDAITRGECPPVILVGVQGVFGSFYTDAFDGGRPIESVIVKELIKRIDNTFRTIPQREYRGVEGFSMGGFGAARLAFEYPDLFGVASMIAPLAGPIEFYRQDMPGFATDVWGDNVKYFDDNDPYVLAERNAGRIRGRTKLRLITGADDRFRVLSEDLHARLDALGIAHEYQVVPGARHNLGAVLGGVRERVFPFWKEAFPPYTPPRDESPTTTAR
jgi:endo-1,4-beta-xylanase